MPKKRENHSSLHFLLFVKEEIALVALYKRAKKAIHTTKRANSSFALKKTSDSHEKPKSELPTLIFF